MRPAAAAPAPRRTNRYKNIKSPPVYRGDLIILWVVSQTAYRQTDGRRCRQCPSSLWIRRVSVRGVKTQIAIWHFQYFFFYPSHSSNLLPFQWVVFATERLGSHTRYAHNEDTINSSPPGQNDRHFADDIFKSIFLNKKICILIKNSLMFVPNGLSDNNPALVSIMVWRWICNKPLSEPMLVRFTDAHICVCVYTALGGDYLITNG